MSLLINAELRNRDEIKNWDEAVENTVLESRLKDQVGEAGRGTFGAFVDLVRITLATFFEQFVNGELAAEGDGAFYRVAANTIDVDLNQAIVRAAGQGAEKKELALAQRYQGSLVSTVRDGWVSEAECGKNERPHHVLLLQNQAGEYIFNGRSAIDKRMQALRKLREVQAREATNEALRKAGREDLIKAVPSVEEGVKEKSEGTPVDEAVVSVRIENPMFREKFEEIAEAYSAYLNRVPEDKIEEVEGWLSVRITQIRNFLGKNMGIVLDAAKAEAKAA